MHHHFVGSLDHDIASAEFPRVRSFILHVHKVDFGHYTAGTQRGLNLNSRILTMSVPWQLIFVFCDDGFFDKQPKRFWLYFDEGEANIVFVSNSFFYDLEH